MNTFPTTPKPRMGSTEDTKYLTVTSKFEGNYSQTRRVNTKSQSTFSLIYSSISDSEYETLKTFFDSNVGSYFNFTNPRDNKTYIVRFKDDNLTRKLTTGNRCDVEITLEEI